MFSRCRPTVPTQFGALPVLELRGGRVHPAHPVLQRGLQAGVPRP